jgi:hypothetical protein
LSADDCSELNIPESNHQPDSNPVDSFLPDSIPTNSNPVDLSNSTDSNSEKESNPTDKISLNQDHPSDIKLDHLTCHAEAKPENLDYKNLEQVMDNRLRFYQIISTPLEDRARLV